VENVQIFTDDHQIMSETTLLVTDLMKRYQISSVTAPSGGTPWQAPLDYSPANGTLGAAFNAAFLYSRGGTMYKVQCRPTITQNPAITNVKVIASMAPSSVATGASMVQFVDDLSVAEFTVPWFFTKPYAETLNTTVPVYGSFFVYYGSVQVDAGSPVGVAWPDVFTAVRDDYQVGYLTAPNTTLVVTAGPQTKRLTPAEHALANVPKSVAENPVTRSQRSQVGTLSMAKPRFGLSSFTLLGPS